MLVIFIKLKTPKKVTDVIKPSKPKPMHPGFCSKPSKPKTQQTQALPALIVMRAVNLSPIESEQTGNAALTDGLAPSLWTDFESREMR
jgi:hypothetical protein